MYNMTKPSFYEPATSFAHYASLAKGSNNLSVTGAIQVGNRTTITMLPSLVKSPPVYAVTSRVKTKITFPGKDKTLSVMPNTLAEVRAEASRELQHSARQMTKPEKGKLPPLKREKEKPVAVKIKKDRKTHIQLINALQEIKGDEKSNYYYCKKTKDFYNFLEDSFSNIDPKIDDYITLSARGVMHFIKKEAEFMTLAEWMDEVENYKKINDIPFFKNFRKGKSFSLWKSYVKRTKMDERKAYLKKALFHGDPQINKHLIGIREVLNTLQNSDLLQVFLYCKLFFLAFPRTTTENRETISFN